MTMTDPIADMLTRLRNANAAYHETVGMPSSTMGDRLGRMGVGRCGPLHCSRGGDRAHAKR